MREIDLVPPDFKQELQLQRAVRKFAVVLFCVIAVVAAVRTGLWYLMKSEKEAIAKLEAGEGVLAGKKKILGELQEKKAGFESRLAILEMLSGGPPAVRMFEVMDSAINSALWFTDWTYTGNVEKTKKTDDYVQTGYFVVKPIGGTVQGEEEVWSKSMNMAIRGQVLSHVALSDFVKKLLLQPEIEDVKVMNTTSREYTDFSVINYDLAVKVRPGGRAND